jgi:Predicted membrane protein
MKPELTYLLASAAVMAVVTYLIRMVSLVIWRKKFSNKYLRSFLTYVPYGVLAALVFPGVLYSTNSIVPAIIGGATALILSLANQKLLVVSGASVAAVFITELILKCFV